MDKQALITLKKELEFSSISLQKFLINYCGIYNEKFHNIKISHKDIKELLPDLRRVSFESLLRDKTGIYTGDIIPVKDSFNNVVPYKNPMLVYDELIEFDCETNKEEKAITMETINEDLSTYELSQLCKYFKTHNRMKEYRATYKILKKKKEQEKKYSKKMLKERR